MESAVKYPRISPWRQAELLERAAMGESSANLAQEFSVHRATVNRLLARYKGEAERQLRRKSRLAGP